MRLTASYVLACLIALSALQIGCTTTWKTAWTPTGEPLADGLFAITNGASRDAMLWRYRTALVALRRGQEDLAATLLDPAIQRLNNLYAPDSAAKKSRGLFAAESKKTFLGEPYERVMAYYYRGLLYWKAGEADNARACFRSALLMDSAAEQTEHVADYALLEYLDSLITRKLGGDGSDAFKRAQTAYRRGSLSPCDPTVNVLVFHECGLGPTKYATGAYGQELRFHEGQSRARAIRVTSAARVTCAGPWDDLSFQATTRGGRLMDHVLANKAVFKAATSTVGDAALITGAILATHRDTDEAGLGLALFGLASKIASAATTPKADTRAWDNLPQYIGVTALLLSPGEQSLLIEFLDATGSPIPDLRREMKVTIPESGKDLILFVSDRKQ